jgi:hypothetical protein
VSGQGDGLLGSAGMERPLRERDGLVASAPDQRGARDEDQTLHRFTLPDRRLVALYILSTVPSV